MQQSLCLNGPNPLLENQALNKRRDLSAQRHDAQFSFQ